MVLATVFDISRPETPLPAQLFFDTNVWLDIYYPPFSVPGAGRSSAEHHSNFFARCLNEGCTILRSAFCLPEIAHVIEGEEVAAYNLSTGASVNRKQSRKMTNLRRKVVAQAVAAWRQMEAVSSPGVGIMADHALAAEALSQLGKVHLDGYDMYLVQEVLMSQYKSIVTNDIDYITVPGIAVYTANQQAITLAANAGRFRPK